MKRRTLVAGAAAGVLTLGGYHLWRTPAEPVIPDAPAGDERLERRLSAARGRTVDFYTAVPAGYGDGRGPPAPTTRSGWCARRSRRGAGALRGVPVGLWCGTGDGLLADVRALERALPQPKAARSYSAGRHNFGYWSTCLPAAFDLVARVTSRE